MVFHIDLDDKHFRRKSLEELLDLWETNFNNPSLSRISLRIRGYAEDSQTPEPVEVLLKNWDRICRLTLNTTCELNISFSLNPLSTILPSVDFLNFLSAIQTRHLPTDLHLANNELDLMSSDHMLWGGLVDLIQNHRGKLYLNLAHNGLNNLLGAPLQKFDSALRASHQPIDLDIGYNGFSDKSTTDQVWSSLCVLTQSCPMLRSLNLRGNNLGNAGADQSDNELCLQRWQSWCESLKHNVSFRKIILDSNNLNKLTSPMFETFCDALRERQQTPLIVSLKSNTLTDAQLDSLLKVAERSAVLFITDDAVYNEKFKKITFQRMGALLQGLSETSPLPDDVIGYIVRGNFDNSIRMFQEHKKARDAQAKSSDAPSSESKLSPD